jgi:hypothetical protein
MQQTSDAARREQDARARTPAIPDTDAARAARELALYIGQRGRDRNVIRGYQRRLGMTGRDVDGIVGPRTRAAMARALGQPAPTVSSPVPGVLP